MSEKFKSVPVDADTAIIFEAEMKLGDRDVLYQKWAWDGIKAESVIFVSDDVALLSDAELEQELRPSPVVDTESQVTIKRSDSGYTFVNFNFTIDDAEGWPGPQVLSPEEAALKKKSAQAYYGSSNDREIERIKKLRGKS